VKPAPFSYYRPASLPDAVARLVAEPDAKVLAGGQSLVPLLNMRLAAPSALVDINALPDLGFVEVTETGVRIGALARHSDVLAAPGLAQVQPLLAMALSHVAHPTIRNRGTTVGSLVHGDPAAEMPAVITLLGGTIDAIGPSGTRTIHAEDLYVGPLESALHHDEIATAAWFPALPAGTGVAFEEIARRHGDYAIVGVAAVSGPDGDRCAYISVSDVPVVVDLTGVPEAEAGALALASLDPVGDIHATADYRAHLVEVLTARVLGAARKASS
jgi:2-furoyl-CoA dehydrogenase FAD binding subunit